MCVQKVFDHLPVWSVHVQRLLTLPCAQVYFDQADLQWRERGEAGKRRGEGGEAGRRRGEGGEGAGRGLAKRFSEWESPALGTASEHRSCPHEPTPRRRSHKRMLSPSQRISKDPSMLFALVWCVDGSR